MAFFDRDCAKKMVSFFFFEGESGVDTNTQSLQIVLIYHLLKLAVFFLFCFYFQPLAVKIVHKITIFH